MKIVVTAGHNKSLHSIALMHTLKKNGHEIVGCILVKTFQIKRLKSYIRQYGWKTVKAKFSSHVLGNSDTYLANEVKPIKDYLEKIELEKTSVTQFCKKEKIKIVHTNSLNEDEACQMVKEQAADLIIYAGGGILRKKIIQSSKQGVLNAHSGWLPFFRGMNAIEWSLLYGFRPHTTIHFIDVGIDTGSILFREPIPYHNDLYTLRGTATVHNIELLNKVLGNFEEYKKSSLEQTPKQGKQFFVMHDRLKEIVAKKLKNNSEDKWITQKDKINELNFK